MTRVLVLSDTQLGGGRNLAQDRLADQEAALDQVADLAAAEAVELVLHTGDVFDSRHPSEDARMVFKRFVSTVTSQHDLVILAGNHDLRNAALPSAVDLYDGCGFVREPRVLRFGDFALACLPWVPSSHYIAQLNGQVARAEVNARIAELLVDAARDLRAECGDGRAILAGHWPVSGNSLPTGLPVEMMGGPVLPLADLEELGFDVALFGDIHVPTRLGDGQVISVGSPALNDFGEEHIAHGVWLIDTDVGHPAWRTIADRRFLTVDVDLTAGLDPDCDETDMIAAAISEHLPLEGAVLRVRYRCTAEQARRVDLAALRGFCHEAGVHKLYSLAPDIAREDRARVEGLTETLSVPAALELWIDAEQPSISDEKAEALRALAAELMEEVRA